MLTTALFIAAAAKAFQNQPIGQNTLSPFSLTGQPITDPFPALPVPSRFVTIDGRAFEVTTDSTLGAFLPNPAATGVWNGIQELNLMQDVVPPKIHVKVALFSDILLVTQDSIGARMHRSSLYAPDREQLSRALIQFELLLRKSGLDPQIEFSEDNDTVFITSENAEIPPLYPELQSILEPRINDDPFDGEDPQYRGPYDVILALHVGLTDRVERGTVGRRELTLLPILTATNQTLDLDVSALMFAAAEAQLEHRRFSLATPEGSWQVPFTARPLTPGMNPTLSAPIPLQGRQAPDPVRALAANDPIQTLPLDTTFAIFPGEGVTRVAATGVGAVLANQLKAPFQNSEVASDGFGRIWIVGTVDGSHTLASIFGLESLPPITESNRPPIPASGVLPLELHPYGSYFYDFSGEQRSVAPIQAIFRTAGGISLIERKSTPVIADPSGKFLTLSLKLKSTDAHSLNFFGRSGKYLGSVQISGEKSDDPRVLHHRINLSGESQSVTVPVGQFNEPIYAIHFGTTPDGVLRSRLVRDPQLNTIESLRVSTEGTAMPDTPPSIESFTVASDLATLYRNQQSGDIREMIASAHAFTQLAGPNEVERLGELARAAREVPAYFATLALARINTPEAQAQLLQTIQQGPFEWNRRCAAMAIDFTPPDHWLDDINFLTSSRSWQVRKNAVRLFPKNQSVPAQIFLVASIQDPVSNVRWEVARGLDPKSNLSARRLLFLAVNDSSEDVRAECYRQLLDSQDAAVLDEALRGIRDESRLVKLTIISRIKAQPDEKFREALRIGMLERQPEIQAAVLEAFALLPETTNFGEVSTAAGSDDPQVQLALLRLADAKGVVLPEPELERLAQSPNPQIAELAKKLKGGS